jgi:Domain of unknown function (DUF4326)
MTDSTSPRRVKVDGDRYHPRVPEGAIYVGRASPYLRASRYANPYRVAEHGLGEALALYRAWLASRPDLLAAARAELAGRDLACWCPLDRPCHADILIDFITGARHEQSRPGRPSGRGLPG